MLDRTKTSIKKQRSLVLRRLDAAQREIDSLNQRVDANGAYPVISGDPAVVAPNSSLSRLREVQEQITELKAALQRMSDGTYGLCGSCGRSIAPGRLEILPHARRCVRCEANGV